MQHLPANAYLALGSLITGRVMMGTLIWANIVVMLLFFSCWAGIPLWHTLHRWNEEITAKHAELAARAVQVPTVPVPVAVPEADIPGYAGIR